MEEEKEKSECVRSYLNLSSFQEEADLYLPLMSKLFTLLETSDTFLHMHISIIFHILFHYRLLQDIEYSPLCYIVSCCLDILYTVVSNFIYCSYMLIPSSQCILSSPYPFSNHPLVF